MWSHDSLWNLLNRLSTRHSALGRVCLVSSQFDKSVSRRRRDDEEDRTRIRTPFHGDVSHCPRSAVLRPHLARQPLCSSGVGDTNDEERGERGRLRSLSREGKSFTPSLLPTTTTRRLEKREDARVSCTVANDEYVPYFGTICSCWRDCSC